MADSYSAKRLCIRSTTTILELNDDVLSETFKHLNDRNLCVVADVCSTFKRNAQAEFASRYKKKYFILRVSVPAWGPIDFPPSLIAIRNFGRQINNLRIILHKPIANRSQTLMELVIERCGETLNGLSLECFHFSASIVPKLRPLLSRLQEISLSSCFWESAAVASDMFSSCPEMHTISIDNLDIHLDFPFRGNMPKLESLILTDCPTIHEETMRIFFEVNQQLVKVKIGSCTTISDQLIRSIAQCCLKIEMMEFDTDSRPTNDFIKNASHLKRSTALKTLSLYCSQESISPVIAELVAAHIQLESLKLHEFESDQELVDGISKMKTLEKLELHPANDIESNEILAIVSNLNELNHLNVTGCSLLPEDLVQIVRCAQKLRFLKYFRTKLRYDRQFGETEFREILRLVAGRGAPLVLNLRSWYADVPNQLRVANANSLQILAPY